MLTHQLLTDLPPNLPSDNFHPRQTSLDQILK